MQLQGATELELKVHQTIGRVETELPASELATTIVSTLSDAVEELQRLRRALDDIANSVLEEGPRTIERLIAIAQIGQATTLIGKARHKQLLNAEDSAEELADCLLAYVEIEESRAPASSSPLRERSRRVLKRLSPSVGQ